MEIWEGLLRVRASPYQQDLCTPVMRSSKERLSQGRTTNLSQGNVKGKGQNTLREILLKRLPRKSWPGYTAASCVCDHNIGS